MEKKDFRKLYEDLVMSDWFKKVYHDKSLGECPFEIPELEESYDERIRKEMVDYFSQYKEDGIRGVDITPWIAYLERQKWDELQSEFRSINEAFEDGKKEVIAHPEKYDLCKSTKWSDEDEKLLDFWLDVIDRNDWRMDENFCKASREFINRIKSLRPFWRPSEEQMAAFEDAMTYIPEFYKPKSNLASLLRDLKKQMQNQ